MKKVLTFTLLVILIGLPGCVSSVSIQTAMIENTNTHTKYTVTATIPISTNTVTPTLTGDSMANSKYYQADCWKNAKTQYDLNVCAGLQEQKSYQALQNLLEEIHLKIGPEAWNEMMKVQSDWEYFRKEDCQIYYQLFNEGSIAPMEYGICLFNHNITRINQLKYFVCEGYGMTGRCDASDKY